ncbi:hypothetical protein [Burkholderia guangdongensis]|uniref:hypothetical protein n=1 Tax=Burkholderia guangdongensis TaxID=1792500 RepID=UPI0015CAB314|nr:hypothetical protein [Burkholderia guangdongensis]
MAELSALDLYKSVHSQKGFQKVETHALSGVIIKVHRGFSDPLADNKVIALRSAINRVVRRTGLRMPGEITLYTSSDLTFVNVAFQRAIGGAQAASIGLGGKLANPMSLPVGIATGIGTGNAFIEAVCVHEIGHILHEMENPEFFWSQEANELPNGKMAGQVSMYAGNNKKEYVAEVFTALVYGQTFSAPVIQQYVDYWGPRSTRFPG